MITLYVVQYVIIVANYKKDVPKIYKNVPKIT